MAIRAITCKIDKARLKARLAQSADKTRQHIVRQLAYIGEECVATARLKGSYNDVTGNLRSSIGYVVLDDGKPAREGMPQQYSGPKGSGEQGAPAAQSMLESLKAKFPSGIVLIVCAGMKYAYYVENLRHKDVLASAQLKAEALIKQLLKGIVD